MSTYICPKCRKDNFTWGIEDDPYVITKWGCYSCHYIAFEDERLGYHICKTCKNKSAVFLKDEEVEYSWCSNCETEHPLYKSPV